MSGEVEAAVVAVALVAELPIGRDDGCCEIASTGIVGAGLIIDEEC